MSSPQVRPFVVQSDTVPLEAWEADKAPGVSWRTLTSADRTPSRELSSGVCYLQVNGELPRHHHAQAEVYHFIAGTCGVLVNDELFTVNAGDTVFIPGNAWHQITNVGNDMAQLFYCFATASFDQIEYHYPDGTTWKA
jgi:quercetin dioxygenase-like cupin family protein